MMKRRKQSRYVLGSYRVGGLYLSRSKAQSFTQLAVISAPLSSVLSMGLASWEDLLPPCAVIPVPLRMELKSQGGVGVAWISRIKDTVPCPSSGGQGLQFWAESQSRDA